MKIWFLISTLNEINEWYVEWFNRPRIKKVTKTLVLLPKVPHFHCPQTAMPLAASPTCSMLDHADGKCHGRQWQQLNQTSVFPQTKLDAKKVACCHPLSSASLVESKIPAALIILDRSRWGGQLQNIWIQINPTRTTIFNHRLWYVNTKAPMKRLMTRPLLSPLKHKRAGVVGTSKQLPAF